MFKKKEKYYYICFDNQHQRERVCYKVKARSEQEAELKAYKAMFAEYDACVSETTPDGIKEMNLIIDKEG